MADSREVNLFNVPLKNRIYPKITDEHRKRLSRFDREYYDDPDMPGFRGYKYNGIWKETAIMVAQRFNLQDGARILDVGCAKGFFLYDLKNVNPSFQVSGVDVSEYAIEHAMPEVKDYITCTSCTELPYDDGTFDLVLSTDVLHNLSEQDCRLAIREINRVGREHRFIMVHSFRNEEEKANLINWEATIRLVLNIEEWKKLYEEENYRGLYYWKIFI